MMGENFVHGTAMDYCQHGESTVNWFASWILDEESFVQIRGFHFALFVLFGMPNMQQSSIDRTHMVT